MIDYSIIKTISDVEVELKGDLDIDSTEIVEEKLLPIVMDSSSVKINFKDVSFIDSSGIGLLLNIVRSLLEKGTLVKIVNVSKEIMEIFILLQIPEIIGEDVFI